MHAYICHLFQNSELMDFIRQHEFLRSIPTRPSYKLGSLQEERTLVESTRQGRVGSSSLKLMVTVYSGTEFIGLQLK